MVHVPLMFLSEWREFPSAPYLAGGGGLVSKSRASPDMLPFSLCNKKRLTNSATNRPLFPTTLSIPSYDIEKWVGIRTYQHLSYTTCPKENEGKCEVSITISPTMVPGTGNFTPGRKPCAPIA